MKMIRCACALALLLSVALNAFAQIGNTRDTKNWTKISDNDLSIYYVDLTSIKGTGTKRRAFILSDHSDLYTRAERSAFFELVFDCSAGTYWLAYAEEYSGQMLAGKILDGGRGEEQWYPVEGAYKPVMKVVCS